MPSNEVITYGIENVESLTLPVTLNGESFIFQGKNVGTAEKPVTIFIFDPRNNELANAAAKDLAKLIPPDSFVVTPYSDKSVPMVCLAASWADQNAQENHGPLHSTVSVFPRKTSLLAAQNLAAFAHSKSIKAGEDRFLGVNYQQAEAIKEAFDSGKTIAVVDDVRSTGSTESAMIAVLLQVIGEKALKSEFREMCAGNKRLKSNPLWLTDQFKFVYVFEEYPFINGQGIPPLPSHVQAVARIPAVIGNAL